MYASLRQKDLVKDLKKERAGAFLGTYLLVTEPACPLGMWNALKSSEIQLDIWTKSEAWTKLSKAQIKY
jgi:hypothetical protein